MPSSGSITSPLPETISTCSVSPTSSIASSRRRTRSPRHSLASSTAARRTLPLCASSFASSRSLSASASAAPPAKPIKAADCAERRTFCAVAFTTVPPIVTCPSEAIAIRPARTTASTVVERTGFLHRACLARPALRPRARVRAIVGFDQSLGGDGGVLLRRRQARVPEQLLDLAQVGAHVEQVCRIAVTQAVRMHVAGDPAAARAARDDAPHVARPEPARRRRAAPQRREERLRQDPRRAPRSDPGRERLARRGGQRHHALLAALAGHPHVAAVQIEIAHVERRQLGDAQPGAIQQLEQRAVAQLDRGGTGRDAVDQAHALVDGQRARQAPGQARRRHPGGGVERAAPLAHQEAEERPQRGELAAERRRTAAAVQAREKAAHVDAGRLIQDEALALMRRELAQVGQVGAPRVGREVALGPQEQLEGAQGLGGVHAHGGASARRKGSSASRARAASRSFFSCLRSRGGAPRQRREESVVDVHRLEVTRVGGGEVVQQRAVGGGRVGPGRLLPARRAGGEHPGEPAERRRLDVALDAGDLARQMAAGTAAQLERREQTLRSVDVGVAVHRSVAREDRPRSPGSDRRMRCCSPTRSLVWKPTRL